ncbi:MAG: hypothetical protein E7655_05780 [Ruminococcaceae bacterium]|nr:hypothetical protein [Oscillospiraceae bacterium]
MKKEEGISWILDRPVTEVIALKRKYPSDPDEYRKHLWAYEDEMTQRKRDFVHSLGLRCDTVGWCHVEADKTDIPWLLDEIERFCKQEGFLARGGYGCSYEGVESDWFEVSRWAPEVPGLSDYIEDGLYSIHAYKNHGRPFFMGVTFQVPPVVSERFRDVCLQNGIPDLRFSRVIDTGRYDASPYFFLFPQARVTEIAWDKGLRYSDDKAHYLYRKVPDGCLAPLYRHMNHLRFLCTRVPHGRFSPLYRRLKQLGGFLPRLAEVFYDFQFHLPDYYPAKALPETGFAQVYDHDRDTLLIHKETAELLIAEKLLSPSWLQPALIYDKTPPPGYRTDIINDPLWRGYNTEQAAKAEAAYEALQKKQRPPFKATEKQTLTLLRSAKRSRKEDFNQKMRQETADSLADTPLAPLIPFYLVANGCFLDDEYRILPYEETEKATRMLEERLASEEYASLPRGPVFCRCPDGDDVILCGDGKVCRISHEVPEVSEEWESLFLFAFECLNNNP